MVISGKVNGYIGKINDFRRDRINSTITINGITYDTTRTYVRMYSSEVIPELIYLC